MTHPKIPSEKLFLQVARAADFELGLVVLLDDGDLLGVLPAGLLQERPDLVDLLRHGSGFCGRSSVPAGLEVWWRRKVVFEYVVFRVGMYNLLVLG